MGCLGVRHDRNSSKISETWNHSLSKNWTDFLKRPCVAQRVPSENFWMLLSRLIVYYLRFFNLNWSSNFLHTLYISRTELYQNKLRYSSLVLLYQRVLWILHNTTQDHKQFHKVRGVAQFPHTRILWRQISQDRLISFMCAFFIWLLAIFEWI